MENKDSHPNCRNVKFSAFNPPVWGTVPDPSDPTGRRRMAKTPNASITLADVADYLRSDTARELWNEARAHIGDKRAWSAAKGRLLPFVCFQGELLRQGDKQMTTYSTLCCIDIDLPDSTRTDAIKAAMAADPVIAPLLVFRSPGHGVKVVTRCSDTPQEYEATYKAILNYIATAHGIECDAKCRNISRLCFLGYDPEPAAFCGETHAPGHNLTQNDNTKQTKHQQL